MIPKRYTTELFFGDSQGDHDDLFYGDFDKFEIHKDGVLVGFREGSESHPVLIAVRNNDGTWCAGRQHPPDGYDTIVIYGAPRP